MAEALQCSSPGNLATTPTINEILILTNTRLDKIAARLSNLHSTLMWLIAYSNIIAAQLVVLWAFSEL